MPSRPANTPPLFACDTHTHIFAPVTEFPLAFPPSYAPPLAPASLHRAMLDAVGMTRAVVVQPAPYGTDMSVLLDALHAGEGRLRGIGTATDSCDDEQLATMRAVGICGLRFTEARMPNGDRYRGSVGSEHLARLAERMRAHAMHAQVWPSADGIPELLRSLLPLEVPLVLEHMGGIDIRRGIADTSFQWLLGLLREGRIWVKLTVCRRSSAAPAYADLRAFHDALVQANPSRLVWGSDWPFVRMAEPPNVAELLDLFDDWLRDADIRRKILLDNPQALYDFN